MKNNTQIFFILCITAKIQAMDTALEVTEKHSPCIAAHVMTNSQTPHTDQSALMPFCTICYEVRTDNDMIVLPCGHQFCKQCISRWHFAQNAHATCPLCRAPISPLTVIACGTFDDAATPLSHQPPLSLLQRISASGNYCSVLCCCCLNQTGQARPIACIAEYSRHIFCPHTTQEESYEKLSTGCCATGCMAAAVTLLCALTI